MAATKLFCAALMLAPLVAHAQPASNVDSSATRLRSTAAASADGSRPTPPLGAAPVATAANAPPGSGAEAQDSVDPALLPASGLIAAASPEQARAFLVKVRVAGRPVGNGVRLLGGRILTSLSAIGVGRRLSASYADASEHALRVERTHRGYDLALLTPEQAVPEGVAVAAAGQQIASVIHWQGARARAELFVATRSLTALGRDSVPLPLARVGPGLHPLGTPLVDDAGRLVGIFVGACLPGPGQPIAAVGDPSAVIACRNGRVALDATLVGRFLGIGSADGSQGFLGIRGESADAGWVRGVRILGFELGSPARESGLLSAEMSSPGDVLIALNGVPVGNPRRLARLAASHRPGHEVRLLVLRGGRLETVHVRLAGRSAKRNQWEISPPLIQPPNPWLGD